VQLGGGRRVPGVLDKLERSLTPNAPALLNVSRDTPYRTLAHWRYNSRMKLLKSPKADPVGTKR
jgi:hypothetical protein